MGDPFDGISGSALGTRSGPGDQEPFYGGE